MGTPSYGSNPLFPTGQAFRFRGCMRWPPFGVPTGTGWKGSNCFSPTADCEWICSGGVGTGHRVHPRCGLQEGAESFTVSLKRSTKGWMLLVGRHTQWGKGVREVRAAPTVSHPMHSGCLALPGYLGCAPLRPPRIKCPKRGPPPTKKVPTSTQPLQALPT